MRPFSIHDVDFWYFPTIVHIYFSGILIIQFFFLMCYEFYPFVFLFLEILFLYVSPKIFYPLITRNKVILFVLLVSLHIKMRVFLTSFFISEYNGLYYRYILFFLSLSIFGHHLVSEIFCFFLNVCHQTFWWLQFISYNITISSVDSFVLVPSFPGFGLFLTVPW